MSVKLFLAGLILASQFSCLNVKHSHRHQQHNAIKFPDENGNLRFATLKDFEKYSLLKDFVHFKKLQRRRKRRVKFPVCFEISDKVTRKEKRLLKFYVQKSINTWLKALKNYKGWDINKVVVKASYQSTCSERTELDRKYIVEYKKDEKDRSYAEYFNYRMVIARDSIKPKKDLIGLFMHEVGHQLGLADTYSERGKQRPIGQDRSIMNLWWEVSPGQIAEDDVVGIRTVWRNLQGEIAPDECPENYVQGTVMEENSPHFFCIRSSRESEIKDHNQQCKELAAAGECEREPGYMLETCSNACRDIFLDNSLDAHPNCALWASLGECEKSPDYMLRSCIVSCEKQSELRIR